MLPIPRLARLLLAFAVLPPAAAQSVQGIGGPRTGAPPRWREAVRVLPLGDSITQGGQGHASYRYPLWFSLRSGSVPVDFVGSLFTVFGGDGGSNPDTNLYPDYYTAFDRDHEGHWGWRTDEILGPSIVWAEAALPDVVLVHLGTNDIGQSGAAGVVNAAANLPRILNNLRAVRPTVRIALAQVVPIGPGSSYFANADQVAPLNAAIATVVNQENNQFSPVVLVDQHTGFDVSTDMQNDGLHPNVAGEQKMADVWEAAVAPLLLPPLPPPHPVVVLLDPSFESLGLADGVVAEDPPIEWTFGATWNTFRGVYNPTDQSYFGAAGGGTPRGADGDEVCYLYDDGGGDERVAAFQTLYTTVEPATTYTLRVAVGNRLPGNPYGSQYGGYRVELLAGDEVIASDADTLTPAPGTFEEVRVSASSDALHPRLLGSYLTIRLTLTVPGPMSSTDFDDVRLVAQ